jgi:nucleoside-diphosphate-sugar epimerase
MILITGATGFIGKNLCKELNNQNLAYCTLSREDASSFESILSFFEKHRPNIVVHLATLYLPTHQPSDIRPMIDSNIRLGTEILEAMLKTGCGRFINTGTLFQNFKNKDYDPYNLYAATKQAFQDLCLHYSNDPQNIKILHLKLMDTYGPGDPRKKIYQLMLEAAKSGLTLELSPGEQYIDPLHIKDVITGFIHAIKNFDSIMHEKQTQTFRLSTGEPITLKTLAATIESVTGKKLKINWGKKPYRPRENFIPITHYDPLPGWKPMTSLTEGIKKWFVEF